eukprot:96425-Pelagomonas_calceolata.AAC.2
MRVWVEVLQAQEHVLTEVCTVRTNTQARQEEAEAKQRAEEEERKRLAEARRAREAAIEEELEMSMRMAQAVIMAAIKLDVEAKYGSAALGCPPPFPLFCPRMLNERRWPSSGLPCLKGRSCSFDIRGQNECGT